MRVILFHRSPLVFHIGLQNSKDQRASEAAEELTFEDAADIERFIDLARMRTARLDAAIQRSKNTRTILKVRIAHPAAGAAESQSA